VGNHGICFGVFWRVEDEDSQATTTPRDGILSAPESDLTFEVKYEWQRKRLRKSLVNHSNWGCRQPSPFISVYGNEDWAFNEARRRQRDGRYNVTVTEIDLELLDNRVEFRNAAKLANTPGLRTSDEEWRTAVGEFLFINCVPHEAAVDVHPV
jgi:hypothetical protein